MADNQSSILQSPNNVEPSLNVENILQEDDDSDVSDNYAGLFPNAEEKPEEIDDIYKQYGMEYKDILEGDKKKKRVAEDAHSFLNFADPSDFDNEVRARLPFSLFRLTFCNSGERDQLIPHTHTCLANI